MQIVIRSNKGPQGWARATMAPLDSATWDQVDNEWIQWLVDHGEHVVTIGETMYQITNDLAEAE